jgi:hypothetical protein
MFIVRVQLIDEAEDYPSLWEALAEQGFLRVIHEDGQTYRLPNATYRHLAEGGAAEVLRLAEQAVAQANRRARILVVDAKSWASSGLEKDDEYLARTIAESLGQM